MCYNNHLIQNKFQNIHYASYGNKFENRKNLILTYNKFQPDHITTVFYIMYFNLLTIGKISPIYIYHNARLLLTVFKSLQKVFKKSSKSVFKSLQKFKLNLSKLWQWQSSETSV